MLSMEKTEDRSIYIHTQMYPIPQSKIPVKVVYYFRTLHKLICTGREVECRHAALRLFWKKKKKSINLK